MSYEEEFAEEIADCIDSIMHEYADRGPIFVSGLFLNGIVHTICAGSKDEHSARGAANAMCDLLKSSIELMIEVGCIPKSKSKLQ